VALQFQRNFTVTIIPLTIYYALYFQLFNLSISYHLFRMEGAPNLLSENIKCSKPIFPLFVMSHNDQALIIFVA